MAALLGLSAMIAGSGVAVAGGSTGTGSTAGTTGEAAEVPRYGYRIVNRYPHDLKAFTQGLTYHGGYLYEGTGKHGMSRLTRRQLESAEVLQQRALPSRYFGEGVEIVGEQIYQLTWRANIVFVYDLQSFQPAGSHYNPGEGWGLAYDGESLIISDGSDSLRFVAPDSFAERRSVQVTLDGQPLPNLNELEFINGEVWANVWQTDAIVRIDPANGQVTGLVDLTGLSAETQLGGNEAVLNGIAWDEEGERLFVTGKYWGDVFEIELLPQ